MLERSRIVGVHRLDDSLIGREVEVDALAASGRARLRLMLGDHCQIDLE